MHKYKTIMGTSFCICCIIVNSRLFEFKNLMQSSNSFSCFLKQSPIYVVTELWWVNEQVSCSDLSCCPLWGSQYAQHILANWVIAQWCGGRWFCPPARVWTLVFASQKPYGQMQLTHEDLGAWLCPVLGTKDDEIFQREDTIDKTNSIYRVHNMISCNLVFKKKYHAT
jgi:hypothetical protein